jgi:ketosteroid isomerase-like protein
MNRRTTLALTTIGLLCSEAAISVGAGTGQAQQSDTDKIKETINGFLEALEALDIHKMEDFWAHDARSTYIGPTDKTITTGWDAVRKKLEGIIAFWSELKHTTQEGPHRMGELPGCSSLYSTSANLRVARPQTRLQHSTRSYWRSAVTVG